MSEGRRVVLSPAAQRQIRKLPPGDAARLRGPILALAIGPLPPGAAKVARTKFWRLRIGELRLIYAIEPDGTVVILRAARRSESTYRRVDR